MACTVDVNPPVNVDIQQVDLCVYIFPYDATVTNCPDAGKED